MTTYPDRVAARAADLQVARVLLGILAAPFWLIGFVVGVIWTAAVWLWAAALVGYSDARKNVSGNGAG